jgi:aminoglycoside phosphotransferase (APT) family kinase protein
MDDSTVSFSDPLRRRPPAEALDWVAVSVGAGAKLVSVRRLTEGHWHANHVVTVRDASGSDHELVLRRWARPGWKSEDPDFTPEREVTVLELLGKSSVPTPRVVNVDPAGTICDVPALLTDMLPGHPPGHPEDLGSFLEQLAEALPGIHVSDGEARRRLPSYERYYDDLESVAPPAWTSEPELWEEALAVAAKPRVAGRECLIHRDYHPGNTLWRDGRLTGVVDWTQGSWGPAAVDTAHMRWNLAVAYGADAADRFLEYYRELTSDPGDDQRYWDIVTVLDVLPDIDPDDLPLAWDLGRLEQYLEAVLGRAPDSR